MATTTNSYMSYVTGKASGVRRLDYFRRPVYLLGFHVYKPPEDWAVSWEELQEIGKKQFAHKEEKIRTFNYKIAEHSGVRKDGAYLPPGITQAKWGKPIDRTILSARTEAEEVMFTCVREILSEKGMKPRDVDMIVVNCSLFNPTPSLAAMIINHFKMRSDIIVYNLGGMGCRCEHYSPLLGFLSRSLVLSEKLKDQKSVGRSLQMTGKEERRIGETEGRKN